MSGTDWLDGSSPAPGCVIPSSTGRGDTWRTEGVLVSAASRFDLRPHNPFAAALRVGQRIVSTGHDATSSPVSRRHCVGRCVGAIDRAAPGIRRHSRPIRNDFGNRRSGRGNARHRAGSRRRRDVRLVRGRRQWHLSQSWFRCGCVRRSCEPARERDPFRPTVRPVLQHRWRRVPCLIRPRRPTVLRIREPLRRWLAERVRRPSPTSRVHIATHRLVGTRRDPFALD